MFYSLSSGGRVSILRACFVFHFRAVEDAPVARLTPRRFSVTSARGVRHPLTMLGVRVMVNASSSGWWWRWKPGTTHRRGRVRQLYPRCKLTGVV